MTSKLKYTTVLIFCLTFSTLQAQSIMNVNNKSGTRTTFILSEISRLTFATGNLIVSKKDATTSSYALTSISYLNFGNYFTNALIEPENSTNYSLLLFPNPVIDNLNLQFDSQFDNKVELQIINCLGKVVLQQTLSCQNGTNRYTVSVAKFQHGIYLCILKSSKGIETNKFLIN